MGKFHQYDLPGEDLILRGLEDLKSNIESIESLLVCIGAPRLRRLNINVPVYKYSDYPEARLYRLLERQNPEGAHSRYNAYIRRLIKFESCLENLN